MDRNWTKWMRTIGLFLISGLLAAAPGRASAADIPFSADNIVAADVDGAVWVHAADLDGDGDLDLISASRLDNTIAWYENTDGVGAGWLKHVVSAAENDAAVVCTADIDADGDLDILSTARGDGSVTWWANDGAAVPGFTANVITGSLPGAGGVSAADVDGDGDLDVVTASGDDGKIYWFENTDGAGAFGSLQDITAGYAWMDVQSVYTTDVDGDGDPDVLSASVADENSLVWYENTAGDGSSWSFTVISTVADGARHVFAADVDGDGDPDVLSASSLDNKVAWYENTDGAGTFGGQQIIDSSALGAVAVAAADMDQDGDLDVLAASEDDGTVGWYENDGSGAFGTRRGISALAAPQSLMVGDVDGDGDPDVASVSESGDLLAWHENTTLHRNALFPEKRVITDLADEAFEVYAADIDGDGDLDVIAASDSDNTVSWFENEDGAGAFGVERIISTAVAGARGVFAADVDGDGDIDVLAAAWDSGKIYWFENTDGAGTFGPSQDITVGFGLSLARSVFAADLDGDGDQDVLSASYGDDKIAWYENTTGDGASWNAATISTAADGAWDVFAADVDGDGDTDVLSISNWDDKVAWYENTDGAGNFGPQQLISQSADGGREVHAVDVDGDGDLDVVSASWFDSSIAWYENLGGGNFGDIDTNRNIIHTAASGTQALFAADLDRDGDADILHAPWAEQRVVFSENVNGDGSEWKERIVSDDTLYAQAVFAADVDGDGDLDVLSASQDDDTIAWFPNQGGQFSLDTIDTAPLIIDDASVDDVLRIELFHNGRSGDADLELATLALLFEESGGDPLTTAEATAIIQNVYIYLDEGSGLFDGGETVAAIVPVSLDAGLLTYPVPDDDANFSVAPGESKTYFVVIQTATNASTEDPHRFQVTHKVTTSTTAEDRSSDVLLKMAHSPEVTSGNVNILSPVLFWVDISEGDDASDGMSPATAWQTLHHAVAQINAQPGGNDHYYLYVVPGTYNFAAGERPDIPIEILQDNVTIEGNNALIDGTDAVAAGWPDGIKVNASGVWLENLKIANFSQHGIFIASGSGNRVIGCEIYDNFGGYGIHVVGGSPEIRGNVLKNMPRGINLETSYTTASPEIVNNLIYGPSSAQAYGIYLDNNMGTMQPRILHNTIDHGTDDGIYVGTGAAPLIKYNSITRFLNCGINNPSAATLVVDYNNVYDNATDFCSLSQGVHGISQDPMFAGTDDYHLTGASPINAIPEDARPLDPVRFDLDQKQRPADEGFDMGCYEYTAAAPVAGRDILIDLYNSTNGDGWDDNSGWKAPPLDSDGFAMPGTECSWFGITCDGGGQIVEIDLAGNHLIGGLPESLGDLSSLRQLYLSQNELDGEIPSTLGNLLNLQGLYLDENSLIGEIPSTMGNLLNLQVLDLRDNNLSGSIPGAIGNLTNLLTLDFLGNQLSGTIPAALGDLENLEHLDISNNNLLGPLPDEMLNLTSLVDDESDLRWNFLFTDNDALRDFFNTKQAGGDWESFQSNPIDFQIHHVRQPDGSFETHMEVLVDGAFEDGLPGSVSEITVNGPSGVLPYTRDDFDYLSQWRDFFLVIPGSPEIGTYTVEVVIEGSTCSDSDRLDVLRTLPIPDSAAMAPQEGALVQSKTPVFTWGRVDYDETAVFYRMEIYDMTDYRVFASGYATDMTAYTLPEDVLNPGETYRWRVRVSDAGGWEASQNRTNSVWLTFTMDAALSHDATPAIDFDSWGAVAYNTTDYTGTSLWLKIIDHDGVAADGSSHQVTAVGPMGNVYDLTFVRSVNAITAEYETWLDTVTAGDFTFTVTDPDDNEGTRVDTLAVNPIDPVDPDTLQPSLKNPVSEYITATFDNVYVNGEAYDDFDDYASIDELDGDRWDLRCDDTGTAETADQRIQFALGDAVGRADCRIAFTDPGGIDSLQADVTVVDSSTDDAPSARLQGTFFSNGANDIEVILSLKKDRVVYSVIELFGGEFLTWETLAEGDLADAAPGETITLSIDWDGGRLRLAADEAAVVYTPDFPVYATVDPSYKQLGARLNLNTDTTPTFRWEKTPLANQYRLRAYHAYSGATIWNGHPGNVDSFRMPPGVLVPNTSYKYRIEARDGHSTLDIDNNAVMPASSADRYQFYTNDTSDQTPFIEFGWNGAATLTNPYGLPFLSLWAKVYDAQGVPDNIRSVTVTLPDGTRMPLYYNDAAGDNTDIRGVYQTLAFPQPYAHGTYTFTVEDFDGHSYSATDVLEEPMVNPIGFPAQSTLSPAHNTVVSGTAVDFNWADVPGAAFYRLDILDENRNYLYTFASIESAYDLPPGFLQEQTLYRYRIRTYREFGEEGVHNQSFNHSGWDAPTFMTGSVTGGGGAPALNLDNKGAMLFHVVNPVDGSSQYWLVFSVKVSDGDGVPLNIAEVTVRFPDEETTASLRYDERISATEATYYVEQVVASLGDVQTGTYTFTVTDFDGNAAEIQDTLAVDPLPQMVYGTPVRDGFVNSTTPIIDWPDVPDASEYRVRIYNGWDKTLHWSGYITDSEYSVPADILTVGRTYSYRVYAYREAASTTDVDNISTTYWSSENVHFTVLATSLSERDALMDLFNATGDENWNNQDGWGGALGSECDWYGVTCDADGHVVGLDLSDNNLMGVLPESLGDLSYLESIDVSRNSLAGPIPDSLADLTQLTAGGSDLRHNFLYSNDAGLTAFVNTIQEDGNWQLTQQNVFEGTVKNVHTPGGLFTYFDLMAKAPFTLEDWVETLTVTGPDGVLPYTLDDFELDPQYGDLFLSVAGSPEIGEYRFTLSGTSEDGVPVSYTYSDYQRSLFTLPLPDPGGMQPAEGSLVVSSTPSFTWPAVAAGDRALYYRLEIFDAGGARVYATGRVKDLLHYTLPEGVLEAGEIYSWRVRTTDSDNWVLVDNRSHNAALTFTMAGTLSHGSMPALDLNDSWGAVTWSTTDYGDELLLSVKVVDHDGVAADGSSHQVMVVYPDATTVGPLLFDTGAGPTAAYYYWVDAAPLSGEYTITVIDPDGNEGSAADDLIVDPLAPVDADSLTPFNKSPAVQSISGTFDNVWVNGQPYEDFDGLAGVDDLSPNRWQGVGCDNTMAIVGQALSVTLDDVVGRGNCGLDFVDPAAVDSIQADITLLDVSSDDHEMRIGGYFYNNGIGDVHAKVGVRSGKVIYSVSEDRIGPETYQWRTLAYGELMPYTAGDTVTAAVSWDGETLTFSADGSSETYTPSGNTTPPRDPWKTMTARVNVSLNTTETLLWASVPGALRYRARIYSHDLSRTIWNGYTDESARYTFPPGVLQPDSYYRLRLEARDAHTGLDNDNISRTPAGNWQNYRFYTTSAPPSEAPYIEFGSHGVFTWNDTMFGSHPAFWIKVYDAQGVPDDIQSVTVAFPDGTVETLYYDPTDSGNTDTAGVYTTESFLNPADGIYTFTVVDKSGNQTQKTEEDFTENTIAFPAADSITPVHNTLIGGTGVDFEWEDVPGAAFYRVEIYDADRKRIHTLTTEANGYSLPPGILKPQTLYSYRITVRREYFDDNVDNAAVCCGGWGRNLYPNFLTTLKTGGGAVPTVSPGDGVYLVHLKHPGSGADRFWLVFQADVSDADGVPANIEKVQVTYPDGETTRDLAFYKSDGADKGQYLFIEAYDEAAAVPEGVYQFEALDADGNGSAVVTDELDVDVVGVPQGLTPLQDAVVYGAAPLISWDTVADAVAYEVAVYDQSRGEIHNSGLVTEPRYRVPSGALALDQVYSYRVSAFKDDPAADRDNMSVSAVVLSEYRHFTTADACPDDPDKFEPGICGCGISDIDSDGDGAFDCVDACPNDPAKTEAGVCGCGVAETDTDEDGTPDCVDECPDDPAKTEAGICGCGVADVDTDGDGAPDCVDGCPNDPNQTAPGVCGCGARDSDGDGILDCIDECPEDPDNLCTCDDPTRDADEDGVMDCWDTYLDNDQNRPLAAGPKDNAVLAGAAVTLQAEGFTPTSLRYHRTTYWEIYRADNDEKVYENASSVDLETHALTQSLAAGLQYYWRAGFEDSSGETRWMTPRYFSIGVSQKDDNVQLAAATDAVSYRMVSVVQWPDDPEDTAVLGDLMQGPYEENYRFGAYNPLQSRYIEYGQGLVIQPGKAFWALAREGLHLEVKGVPVSMDHDVAVELFFNPTSGDGWNMIACPNAASYRWADVELLVMDADGETLFGPTAVGGLSAANPYISRKLWRWEDGAYADDTRMLMAYQGYWVKVNAADLNAGERVFLVFPAHAQQLAQSASSQWLAQVLQRSGEWIRKHVALNREAAADDESPPMPMGDFSRSTDSLLPESCFIDSMDGHNPEPDKEEKKSQISKPKSQTNSNGQKFK